MNKSPIVIIGAGPAGLSAALEIIRRGERPVILEAAPIVGGIARTESYRGYHFDVGGHRFYTKNITVQHLWEKMLEKKFIKVRRKSRIYYNDRFLAYPLKPLDTLSKMGVVESLRILASYMGSRIRPDMNPDTFENWVCNRFGRRLYDLFFKDYTEKVWGLPCDKIRADWATQRIKGLSLTVIVSHALFKGSRAKSLIETFYYPERGPGMMWECFAKAVETSGGRIMLNSRVVGVSSEKGRVTSIDFIRAGHRETLPVGRLISSLPLSEFVDVLHPEVPESVRTAARKISYRAFIIVVLIIDQSDIFSDQWLYIHHPHVRVGRIQNFKNWSPDMVPDAGTTSLGLEYFCSEGDDLWQMNDDQLRALAVDELQTLEIAPAEKVLDGTVLRQPRAYPVYDLDYRHHVSVIRDHIGRFENVQTIGRNGQHRYNNQDHSMLTGIMAARNLFGSNYDPWEVNEEETYLEADHELIRRRQQVLARAFARVDQTALGIAMGTVSGLILFWLTLWPIIMGNQAVKPFLSLLDNYFIGYTPTIPGAFIGLGYGFLVGGLTGWFLAGLRNLFLLIYICRARKKAEVADLHNFSDLV